MSKETGLQLRIVREPDRMWYKDVGGKRKHMTCILELAGWKKLANKGAEFNLSASLNYESGKKLADEWQWILHFLDLDQSNGTLPVLKEGNKYRAELHFRIEKVSTSFMNQRFSVHFRAVPVIGTVPARLKSKMTEEALSAHTNPIESKAKPKRTSVGTRRKRVTKRATSTRTTRAEDVEEGSKKRLRRRDASVTNEKDVTKRLLLAIERVEETQRKLDQTERRLAGIASSLSERLDALDGEDIFGTSSRVGYTGLPKLKRLPSWERPFLTNDDVSSLTSDEATPEMKFGQRSGSVNMSPPNLKLPMPRFTSVDFAAAFNDTKRSFSELTKREDVANVRARETR